MCGQEQNQKIVQKRTRKRFSKEEMETTEKEIQRQKSRLRHWLSPGPVEEGGKNLQQMQNPDNSMVVVGGKVDSEGKGNIVSKRVQMQKENPDINLKMVVVGGKMDSVGVGGEMHTGKTVGKRKRELEVKNSSSEKRSRMNSSGSSSSHSAEDQSQNGVGRHAESGNPSASRFSVLKFCLLGKSKPFSRM